MSWTMRIGPEAVGRLAAVACAGAMLAACADTSTWPGPAYYQADVAYCYKTLAKMDCFANPQPGQNYRLVGYSVTAPR